MSLAVLKIVSPGCLKVIIELMNENEIIKGTSWFEKRTKKLLMKVRKTLRDKFIPIKANNKL